jgi:hypothetical protein
MKDLSVELTGPSNFSIETLHFEAISFRPMTGTTLQQAQVLFMTLASLRQSGSGQLTKIRAMMT